MAFVYHNAIILAYADFFVVIAGIQESFHQTLYSSDVHFSIIIRRGLWRFILLHPQHFKGIRKCVEIL
ncbi:hypothetical protein D3C71_1720830 [compost metagenome]